MRKLFYLPLVLFVMYSCDDPSEEINIESETVVNTNELADVAAKKLQSNATQEAYISKQLSSLQLSVSDKEKTSKNIGNAHVIGQDKILNNLGNYYYDSGNMDLAIYFYLQSLQLKLLETNNESRSITYRNLGLAFQAKGDYTNAAISFWQALLLIQEGEDTARAAKLYNDLGVVYDLAHDFILLEDFAPESSIALFFYESANTLYGSISHERGLEQISYNISLLLETGRDSSAAISRNGDVSRDQDDVEDQL